ncbi:MAG: DUF1667 domain-containing protein [Candidatus Thorarchaeota archaeon]
MSVSIALFFAISIINNRLRSDKVIPKEKLQETLEQIAKKTVKATIKMGDNLIKKVLGLNINIIASRDLIKA